MLRGKFAFFEILLHYVDEKIFERNLVFDTRNISENNKNTIVKWANGSLVNTLMPIITSTKLRLTEAFKTFNCSNVKDASSEVNPDIYFDGIKKQKFL